MLVIPFSLLVLRRDQNTVQLITNKNLYYYYYKYFIYNKIIIINNI